MQAPQEALQVLISNDALRLSFVPSAADRSDGKIRIYYNQDITFHLHVAQHFCGPLSLWLVDCEIKASEGAPLRAVDRAGQLPPRKDSFAALLHAEALPCGYHEFTVKVRRDESKAQNKLTGRERTDESKEHGLTVAVGSREVGAITVHVTHDWRQNKRKRRGKKMRQHESMDEGYVEALMPYETHSSMLGLLQHETGPVLSGQSEPVPYGLSGQTNGGQHPHHHHADSSVPHWAPPAYVTANTDTTGGHEPAFDGGVPFSPLFDLPEELLRGGFSPSQPAQAPPTAYEKGKEKESDPPEGEGTDGHQVRDAMASDDAQQATAEEEEEEEEEEAREQLGLVQASDHKEELERYLVQAVDRYHSAAARGSAQAIHSLGHILESCHGHLPDALARAAAFYRQAAEQGYVPSQRSLARLYEDGRGVPQSSEDAATWYRRAADQGDAEAQWFLGMLWEAGPGMTHDLEEAKEWYRKAAEQDHEMALCRLGVIYEEGQQEPRDLEAAVRFYTRAADLGNPVGQWLLGRMWAAGRGVPQSDDKQAMMWFHRAALQNESDGKWRLAWMYETGADRDYEQAVYWYNDAIILAQNDGNAYWRLGCMHATGRGVPVDLEQALAHHRRAVVQGPADPSWRARWLYRMTPDVPPDYRQAIEWYLQAAEESGSVNAQWLLGFMYQAGRGVPRDRKQAARWYRLAADQGDADAQWRLGRLLEEGDGVACDYVQAAGWYGRAAEEQNHPNALCSLGLLYERGRGVERNLEQAMELYRRAANLSVIDPAAAKLGREYLKDPLSAQR